jgi:hypothetical protein
MSTSGPNPPSSWKSAKPGDILGTMTFTCTLKKPFVIGCKLQNSERTTISSDYFYFTTLYGPEEYHLSTEEKNKYPRHIMFYFTAEKNYTFTILFQAAKAWYEHITKEYSSDPLGTGRQYFSWLSVSRHTNLCVLLIKCFYTDNGSKFQLSRRVPKPNQAAARVNRHKM